MKRSLLIVLLLLILVLTSAYIIYLLALTPVQKCDYKKLDGFPLKLDENPFEGDQTIDYLAVERFLQHKSFGKGSGFNGEHITKSISFQNHESVESLRLEVEMVTYKNVVSYSINSNSRISCGLTDADIKAEMSKFVDSLPLKVPVKARIKEVYTIVPVIY